MKFSLIICTYMRPNSVLDLLNSVSLQTNYPDQILIIDSSTNDLTKVAVLKDNFRNLTYYAVPPEERGLTKQRNFGISKVSESSEIVCFLDDDTVLKSDYFEQVLHSFATNSAVIGVGGVAINENNWIQKKPTLKYSKYRYFQLDNFVYPEGQRNVVRNILGLQSNLAPGKMPDYSHGRTCGFPLNGKSYDVDLIVGMSMSFRNQIFNNIKFSAYFEGYGLYEDADFSIRALDYGRNIINTAAQLAHNHEPSGRPNQYQYGKMVVRNGWYVWRVKNPNPFIKDKFKWHAITILLILIRLSNVFTKSNRQKAFTETVGRIMGWWSLTFSKPREK